MKVTFPSTSASPAPVEALRCGAVIVLSTVVAAGSTRIPVAAPVTVRFVAAIPQCPFTWTPWVNRAGGVPPRATTRTPDSETGARSDAPAQEVCTPAPVDASFRTSNPSNAPPGPMETNGPVSAAAVLIT